MTLRDGNGSCRACNHRKRSQLGCKVNATFPRHHGQPSSPTAVQCTLADGICAVDMRPSITGVVGSAWTAIREDARISFFFLSLAQRRGRQHAPPFRAGRPRPRPQGRPGGGLCARICARPRKRRCAQRCSPRPCRLSTPDRSSAISKYSQRHKRATDNVTERALPHPQQLATIAWQH